MITHFRATFCLCFKTRPSANLSYGTEFDLHENKDVSGNISIWMRFRIKTCFDIEVRDNSEIWPTEVLLPTIGWICQPSLSRHEFLKTTIRESLGLIFSFTLSAMKVAVLGLDRTSEGDWIRVTVNVMTRYKRSLVRLRLGNEFLWIPRRDYKCKCPRLRPGRDYLIAGSIRSTSRKKSIVVDHRSMVVSWNKNMDRKVEMIKKKCQTEKDAEHRYS